MFTGGKMIKLNIYHSDGKEWYINSALILAFEEVK
nr:MAG TPA: Flagellar and Swarming motility protein [Caudoviricetes sp.]